MAVREAIPRQDEAQEGVSSFAKSLFLGEIHEELVFPWPATDADEQDRIRELNRRIRDYCAEHYDAHKAEEDVLVKVLSSIPGGASLINGCAGRIGP